MKTAKEIAEDMLSEVNTRNKPPEDVNEMLKTFIEEINAYARQKCKEQRDLCVEYGFVHHWMENETTEEKVRLAPEPEFD